MPENPAAAFIAALKAKLKVDSDERLANAIGVGKSTLATWRQRGSVPKRVRGDILIDFGVDYDLTHTNPEGSEKLIQTLIRSAVFLSLIRLGGDLPVEEQVEFASWLADNEHEVRFLVLEHFEKDDSVRANPAEFTKLLMRVARGEHATSAQLIELKKRSTDKATKLPTEFPT